MKIVFHKSFNKAYKKLNKNQQKRINATLVIFNVAPFSPQLKNHSLKGKLKNMRSISAGFDLRLVYTEKDNHIIVIFLDVGSHNQVY